MSTRWILRAAGAAIQAPSALNPLLIWSILIGALLLLLSLFGHADAKEEPRTIAEEVAFFVGTPAPVLGPADRRDSGAPAAGRPHAAICAEA